MTPRITKMEHRSGYRVCLKFEDGKCDEIDLKEELWGPVFELLKSTEYFRTGKLDQELNTVCWDNGADFAPEFLYDNLEWEEQGTAATA